MSRFFFFDEDVSIHFHCACFFFVVVVCLFVLFCFFFGGWPVHSILRGERGVETKTKNKTGKDEKRHEEGEVGEEEGEEEEEMMMMMILMMMMMMMMKRQLESCRSIIHRAVARSAASRREKTKRRCHYVSPASKYRCGADHFCGSPHLDSSAIFGRVADAWSWLAAKPGKNPVKTR